MIIMERPQKPRPGTTVTAVVGLGWMGLPIAAIYADAGYETIGYDIDHELVKAINNKTLQRDEQELDQILEKTLGKNLHATTNPQELSRADIISVVVPLVTKQDKTQDWTPMNNAIQTIAQNLKQGALVIIHTTMPIGATRNKIAPILDTARKKYHLAYMPIRAMTPHAIPDMRQKYPRVVGGIDQESTKLAIDFYSTFFKNKLIPLSLEEAEATKLFEVTSRDVNIALANELYKYCQQLGLDYWKIRQAVNTDPAYELYEPGPGVGGHCLPVYPHLLMSSIPRLNQPSLVKDARQINDQMPEYTVEQLEKKAREKGKKIQTVTIYGFGYRPATPETRFSPAIQIARLLHQKGYQVWANDPHIPDQQLSQWGKPVTIQQGLQADAIIITTKHPEYHELKNKIPRDKIIIDTRRALGGIWIR